VRSQLAKIRFEEAIAEGSKSSAIVRWEGDFELAIPQLLRRMERCWDPNARDENDKMIARVVGICQKCGEWKLARILYQRVLGAGHLFERAKISEPHQLRMLCLQGVRPENDHKRATIDRLKARWTHEDSQHLLEDAEKLSRLYSAKSLEQDAKAYCCLGLLHDQLLTRRLKCCEADVPPGVVADFIKDQVCKAIPEYMESLKYGPENRDDCIWRLLIVPFDIRRCWMDNPQATAILQEMKWAFSSRMRQVAAAVWLSCLVWLVTRVRHEPVTLHPFLLDLTRHALTMSPHNTL
jgi:hypothetical protein